ncbi:MAG TPA: hypothetical protein VHG08_08610 [Longimicrobium sp.]|nr:hypothetical protein [Longimicrobium sp.]
MPKRKTLSVPVDKNLLSQAREILGTNSDTETVAAALDLIVFRDEVTRGIRALAGSNSIRDIYADED